MLMQDSKIVEKNSVDIDPFVARPVHQFSPLKYKINKVSFENGTLYV